MQEILIVLSILGVVSLGVFAAFKAGTSAWITSQQYVAEQQNGRSLLNAIASNVRMIGYGYTGSNAPVISGGTNDLAFYDADPNTGSVECRHYYLNSGTVYQAIVQGAGCASSILSASGQPATAAFEARVLTVSNLTFQYYAAADIGGALLPAPLSASDLFLVQRIDISAQVKGVTAAGAPLTVHTQAVVRNAK